jgi:osmotically-inducible protein OsmY
MFTVQDPKNNSGEFSRYKEHMQMADHKNERFTPIQKTDATIKNLIDAALWRDDVLRATEIDEIDVRVKDGVVYLSGHIVSATSQRLVENAIQTIPGIEGINNNLVLDDKLTLEVAASLGDLERTYNCKFFTGASHGVVSVDGIVENNKVKLLAEQCAASNSHVRGVISTIRTSRTGLKLHSLPFLQPTIGELIYFLDGVSGVVKQVVINPNNRRVIAMVIQGKFNDLQNEKKSLTNGRTRLLEQLVIVPVSMIRFLTKVSGFLYILSSERKQNMDFDPGNFFVPNKDWVPPYPYCPVDVLFPIKYQNADSQIVPEPGLFPFGGIVEEASVREEFFATDSLGL